MQNLSKLKYATLYWIWIGLFAVTAILGLVFPDVENGVGRFFLALVSVLFFLPPWTILFRAKKEDNRHHVRIIRYLAIANLSLTLVLLCAGILSVRMSAVVGNMIHTITAILCTPLICSNYYVLPMFLWATLFTGSFGKQK